MNQLKWIKGDLLNQFSKCCEKLNMPFDLFCSAYYGIVFPPANKFLYRMPALFLVFPRE